jgi:hypothetical protein
MKRIGKYNGIVVYEDPNAPPNMLYFMNDRTKKFHLMPVELTRWRRLKLWTKRILNKLI